MGSSSIAPSSSSMKGPGSRVDSFCHQHPPRISRVDGETGKGDNSDKARKERKHLASITKPTTGRRSPQNVVDDFILLEDHLLQESARSSFQDFVPSVAYHPTRMPAIHDNEVLNDITFVVFKALDVIIQLLFDDSFIEELDGTANDIYFRSYDVQDEEGDPEKLENIDEHLFNETYLLELVYQTSTSNFETKITKRFLLNLLMFLCFALFSMKPEIGSTGLGGF